MKNIWLVARRELAAYFRTPMGYVIVTLALFVNGLLFNFRALGGDAKQSTEVLQLFFAFATFMTMVSGILLSMRLFSEDRQLGTLPLLLTAPIHDREIVLGKFLSGWLFLLGMTLLTIYMPLLIFVHGKVSLGHIFAGYIGLMMIGGLALAVGLFSSSVSPNQIIAGVSGAALMTAIYLCYLAATVAEPPLREIIVYASPQRHLQWQNGILTGRDVFYYLSATYLFLLLSTQALHARRWR